MRVHNAFGYEEITNKTLVMQMILLLMNKSFEKKEQIYAHLKNDNL